ncbi:uncharacterized protein LOC129570757 [Sitodiplosis mosellana]|uniref:uncharacterized protein LOC129570757 n=1 Tax=Sitodiplosis mosellana TaxID=263140 RepID=UPI00244453F7|nr:uncharacterized protein LOC129570757 [Sitodiplosis mosellana]
MYSNKYTNGHRSTETVIDLRSDAVSQPTEQMRRAMANAEVGDDVFGEDPTVQKLERQCAELFGKEAALFVSSGTMGHLISIMVHCNQRGCEVIVGGSSHVYLYEQGGAATIAGVSLDIIPNNEDGTYSLDEFRSKIRGSDEIHEPTTTMAVVENTHNISGGKVVPLEWIDKLASICKSEGIKLHMDGSRVFHAAKYLNVPVSRIARDFDSLTFCLTKVCAPIGSVLLGSKDFIRQARRIRKALGGGMRQVGVLAAAGLVALREVVPKLGDDHRHTKQIAQAIYDSKSPFITVEINKVQTNICMIHLLKSEKYSAKYFVERLQKITPEELSEGITDKSGNGVVIKVCARDEWNCIRYVVYHHIDDESTELAIKKIKYCIAELN